MSSSPNSKTIERISIEKLQDYQRNPRVHNRAQRRKIAALIKRYGQVWPILASPDLTIIDGHALRDALRAEGFTEVDVIIVHDQSPEEIKALRLAINRLPLDTRWDNERLKSELTDLLDLGFDLELTGFDIPEIDFALKHDFPTANTLDDYESIPRRQNHTAVRPGDVFLLDRHRYGCGDARSEQFVGLVCGGRKAQAAFVDPPYNVPIAGFVSGKGRHKHEDFIEASGEMPEREFYAFLHDSLVALHGCCEPSAVLFVCMDWRHILPLTAAGKAIGLPLVQLCVWAKSNPGMGSLYRNQHELVAVFKAGNEPHRNNVQLGRFGRNRSNIWQYADMSAFGKERDDLLSLHPTVKPVPLIADAIRDVTKRSDVVLDTFCGYGSTLIAAEETGRTCFAVERDPKYVDVSIRRWQAVTGKDAVHAVTGQRFNDLTPLLASPEEGS